MYVQSILHKKKEMKYVAGRPVSETRRNRKFSPSIGVHTAGLTATKGTIAYKSER